jgi:cell division protein FtsB
MAKALVGYLGSDARLLDDNQRLRRRVADLEAVVLRLQAENDALAAQVHDGELLVVPDAISATAGAGA